MTREILGAAVSLGVLLGACGGKAVVDGTAPGEAGTGGATTTTTTGGATTTTTTGGATTSSTTGWGGTGAPGDPCLEAEDWLETNNAAATYCNPYINMPQCDGSAFVYDFCGCQVLANEGNVAAIAAALDAYQSWVGLGCGPWDCTTCPVFGPGGCIEDPGGATGHCETVTPL